jgi:hypothetical protein
MEQEGRVIRLETQMSELKEQVTRTEDRLTANIDEVKATLNKFIESADRKYAEREKVEGLQKIVFWIVTLPIGILVSIIIYLIEKHIL